MTDHGVPDNDMLSFPWQTRSEARVLDALLSGNCQPQDAPAALRPVAEVLATLQAPADQREVARWGEVLVAYREVSGMSGTSSRPRSRRPGRIAASLSAKRAAASVAVVAALGGGIAAAYTGSLPVGLQKIAHDTIAAPVARESRAAPAPRSPRHQAGPSATASAAYGSCAAYQHADEHGDARQRAAAWRHLVNAAGGVGRVVSYCARVLHPGAANPPGRQARRAGPPGRQARRAGPPKHAGHHRPKSATAPGSGTGRSTRAASPQAATALTGGV